MKTTEAIKNRALPPLDHTTGLSYRQLASLAHGVERTIGPWQPATGRQKSLSVFMAVVVTVNYLRRNDCQEAVGEHFLVSQSTVSRYIKELEPVVSVLLDDLMARLRAAALAEALIVDGFLVPTGERKWFDGLYSGKRHDTGANLQAIATLHGRVIELSPPLRGSVHDSRAFTDTGLDKVYRVHCSPEGPGMLGDKAYIGKVPITPVRKPAYRNLTEEEREFNRGIKSHRAAVERGISHLRNWRILATGYRRPLRYLYRTSQTVMKLEQYAIHPEEAFA
ncbi:transposase family protein [Salininema proteolyticum]|uniref:Transposase family protein n=1 Tax=Salininema proteolyticum TaxID=1607685 RepID=A0ABV8U4V0_9ACTN